jgi:4-hydroxythreonine-4-phosphate dehydrogenase
MKRIGISMGDPAGIGPEVLLAALARRSPQRSSKVCVFGVKSLLDDLALRFDWHPEFELFEVAGPDDLKGVRWGSYTRAGGRVQLACLQASADALEAGRIHALVTGPIHKRALFDAGGCGPGHTEWLANRFGVELPVMMLSGPTLRVVLATTHVPLRDVAKVLNRDSLWKVVNVTHRELARFFFPQGPRLALAALNPHGEEDGRLGLEEKEILEPTVAAAQAANIDLKGPIPGDAVFAQAVEGRFDAVIALYHDQGLAPLKTLHFSSAVNVTLGLGRIRVSPDHGPAYDIAGKGQADPGSMQAAIELADRMITIAQP